jgi:large-conductance mechanosensitive channel|tara:strand:- start:1028 stop:1186 length:159 start_codon:yes stop_codon:yes gene_type:complete
MQKIIFITLSLLIIGYVVYMGVMAVIRGKKYKEENQAEENQVEKNQTQDENK